MHIKLNEPWFRPRGYLHFDVPIGEDKARKYVSNPKLVERHAFFPLIRYTISTSKIRLDKTTGKLVPEPKDRQIAYASHLDSHILSYYAHQLAGLYEEIILKTGLSDSVLAFRSIGFSNIDFAGQAFANIRGRTACTAIALDVKGFFDNLDHELLKHAWCKVLGVDRLPGDHFAVFKGVTSYSTVNRTEVYAAFGISEHNPKHDRQKICEIADFRNVVRTAGLIDSHPLKHGIPQGTPISALLSNIYMLDFDIKIHSQVTSLGGAYLRYCDDILIVVPPQHGNKIAGDVRVAIKLLKLDINPKKTETSRFSRNGSGDLKADRPLQYLGFTFDGQRTLIRSAALARYSQRMKKGVHLAKATALSRNKQRVAEGRCVRGLFKRKLFEKYSHLGKKNFIRYGYKAAEILQSSAIKAQLEPLWARLLAEISKA
jgi:RNA-directed DNA polymerase